MNNMTIIQVARYALWFIITSVLLSMVFCWVSVVKAADEEFSLSEQDGTVYITCRSNSCELKSVVIDRGSRTGWRPIVLGPGVEDLNFGKRTEAQVTGEHVRTFNIDLADGNLVSLLCTVPAIHLLVESERTNKCIEREQGIKMKFGFRIGLYAPNALEVDINNGQAVFTHKR